MITTIDNFSEPTNSIMFLTHVSCVDHAYIDNNGCVVGGSFHPNFIIGGTPDPVEKVVVDFSTVKKDVKQAIDQHIFDDVHNGFDHKLWIIEGYSNVTSVKYINNDDGEITDVEINTPNLFLQLPLDAVKLIKPLPKFITNYDPTYIGEAFRVHVYDHLLKKYPNINLTVECSNTVDPHLPIKGFGQNINGVGGFRYFSYVHGLKDSTSYGCQNVAHGHLSFIQVDVDPNLVLYEEGVVVIDKLLDGIACDLDNTVFVREENIVGEASDSLLLKYTTKRGNFVMVLNTNQHKIVVLPTETTVEFLTHYVIHKYRERLVSAGVTSIFVSEGLSKGSMVTL